MSIQEEVDIFMNKYGMHIDPEYRAMDVVAECGEVINTVLETTNYGDTILDRSDKLQDELGDLYFALIAFANSMDIDLNVALDNALKKYEERLESKETPSSTPKAVPESEEPPGDFAEKLD